MDTVRPALCASSVLHGGGVSILSIAYQMLGAPEQEVSQNRSRAHVQRSLSRTCQRQTRLLTFLSLFSS